MFQSIFKLSIFFVLAIGLVSHADAQTQQWECAVNLQQGDTGVMSLSRDGDQVQGELNTTRNRTSFKSELKGGWKGNEINLTRLLDANSNEPMAGIVVTLGTEKIKIGGRFSSEYQGVWSADCSLVSSTSSNDVPRVKEPSGSEPSAAIPALTSRVTPSVPSSKDQITLSARASHPDGIESLDFFVGGKKVHSCNNNNCSFKYGALKSGNYTWYTQATSKSGVTSIKQANKLIVSTAKAGTCIVSGVATGPSANLSLSYRVILVGLDGKKRYRNSTEFNKLKYRFNAVPKGEYTISVDTLADSSVLWSPREASIKCDSQADLRQNFDFR